MSPSTSTLFSGLFVGTFIDGKSIPRYSDDFFNSQSAVQHQHHQRFVPLRRDLNPYRLDYYLLLDIEDRWNRGAFGAEYERCTDRREKKAWDKKLGLGREKLFEVRRIYNDVGFIDGISEESHDPTDAKFIRILKDRLKIVKNEAEKVINAAISRKLFYSENVTMNETRIPRISRRSFA